MFSILATLGQHSLHMLRLHFFGTDFFEEQVEMMHFFGSETSRVWLTNNLFSPMKSSDWDAEGIATGNERLMEASVELTTGV